MVEAVGMPKKVLNFVPGCPETFMDTITNSKDLGGLALQEVHKYLIIFWKKFIIIFYNQYPRVVGETGGNNYHFVFPCMKDKLKMVVEKDYFRSI